MPIIKVKRDYCGEEGTDADKNVLSGSEHSVTRARAIALKASGLVEIISDEGHPDDGGEELRTDGPTVDEYVAAGYPAKAYPPSGYASRSSAEEITNAITAQAVAGKQKEKTVNEEKQSGPTPNKAARAPKNKAAPKAADKNPAQDD